ncbi:MAG TPA: biopolymer transporter ExbD [Steroidobacteraceae bacterium]|nr:biopolymer transporter ExbD [Steroidobacteraceae bacterium]
MAMSVSQGQGEPFSEMNTTPLIDVMLVLLIMFIITMPAMMHSVNLNVSGGKVESVALEPIRVGIGFDGTITLDGSEVQSLAMLERYFSAEGRKAEQREVHVSADQRAKYDTVAKVLAIAQRNGLKRIGIEGNE